MSATPDQPIVVFITAPDQDEASRLANMLVERNLGRSERPEGVEILALLLEITTVKATGHARPE